MLTENIETDRLILRTMREEDSILCFSIWLDDEMGKYLSDPPREKADEAYLSFAKGIELDESWFPFIAVSKDTNDFIGTCSIVPQNDSKQYDLGYCVHKKYWRQGYATEIIKALINYGYRKGVRVFTADVAQENSASNAVLRKLGFFIEKEGSFKKYGTDIVYKNYTYRLNID